ncbi:hypothetical protein L596_017657 [Steinernema carpocapsae]|uniref:Uncharacterized protein n=1 Tax=Steinernema carpocapsae TaxID=34508 RepID=A0A4U5N310_STECR|nr:hypothetical protein L596_017657 [Steinernema carpocapsae]
MEPNTTKIILLVAMFLVTLVFGLIPIKVYRLLTDQRRTKLIPKTSYKSWLPSLIISLLTCFAGGVFLSIVFLDLLPDAEEAFKSLKEKNVWNVDYPVVQCASLS